MTVPQYVPSPPPQGWWRTRPDSSGMDGVRAHVVVFVPLGEVDEHAQSWATSLSVAPDSRLPLPDMGLTVITVGGVAVIGATPEALALVGGVRSVVLVPDLDRAMERFPAAGITVDAGPYSVAVGRAVYVTTPDGTACEWVEHRPRPGEVPRTS